MLYNKKTKNNRGQTTILMIILLLGLFFSIILLLVGGIVAVRINNALNQNITLGNTNLATINSQTFGIYTTTYLNSADWWGISALFGMIIGLFLSAYFTRGTFPKIGIILDIFIILGIFIFALYLSETYQTLLDSLSSAGETFLEDYTPNTSSFMLNLPIYVVIIGCVMMILFHSSIPRKQEENNFYQRGFQGIWKNF